MRLLQQRGHELVVASRSKDVALELLEEMNIANVTLSSHQGGGIITLLKELFQRDRALAGVVHEQNIDLLTAIGGTFSAHAGKLTGKPSLVFYDTENATLQNLITYPFSSHVFVPRAYQAWTPKRHSRYAGYHELSYLHPNYFKPNRDLAIANGLSTDSDTFLIRLVSWQANHDIGEKGWRPELLTQVLNHLQTFGKVLISSEAPLPEAFDRYRYQGKVSELHHLMAFCRGHIGESATMASESAVLGIPAIYAANTGRGYTDEQEARYGLVQNLSELNWDILKPALDKLLLPSSEHWHKAHQTLLKDTIDVARYVADCIEQYPALPNPESYF